MVVGQYIVWCLNDCGKCRKALPKWSTQVRVNTVQDVGPLDDGFCWRKYGQKDILGAKYPRLDTTLEHNSYHYQ
jgi:hypothetical protein